MSVVLGVDPPESREPLGKHLGEFDPPSRSWQAVGPLGPTYLPSGERAGKERDPPPSSVACPVTSFSRLSINTCFHSRLFPIFKENYLQIALQNPSSSEDKGGPGSAPPPRLPPPQQARAGKIGYRAFIYKANGDADAPPRQWRRLPSPFARPLKFGHFSNLW